MSQNTQDNLLFGQNASSHSKISLRLQQKPRILVISMRGCHSEAFRASNYEFEDAICTFDYADLLAPVVATGFYNQVSKKLANYLGIKIGKSQLLRGGCSISIVDVKYDLFFFICQNYWDVTCVNSIKGWRENSGKAILWIDEIWAKEVGELKTRLCLNLFKEFDYIFTTHSHSVDAIANFVEHPCYFLPFAVDAVKFCPYPRLFQRSIDVYSIGRRSPIVHKALLELAERGNFLYLYDTLKGLQMIDYKEHRTLYSHLIKNSRYFIANKAKFDSDHQTGGQEELGARFFEGAAGGAVIIGTPPVCKTYTPYFDWPNAVVEIAYDATNVADVIAELDAHPDHLNRIRKDNVVNSLLRHDWVYRWEQILKIVGLDNTPQMLSRQAYLKNLAEMVSAA